MSDIWISDKMATMEIRYSGTHAFSDPFVLANRHFQVAFSEGQKSAIATLWNQGVIDSADPNYPVSLVGRVKHFSLALLELIPVMGNVIAILDRWVNACVSLPPTLSLDAKQAVRKTPKFDSYKFGSAPNVRLTDLGTRPANLLYQALFGSDPTTQPGSGSLFAFLPSPQWARRALDRFWGNPTFTVTARKQETTLFQGNRRIEGRALEQYFGTNQFQISLDEIHALLDSQKICVSPLIPKSFYLEMKQALKNDGIIILPGDDARALTLGEILKSEYEEPTSWEKVFGKVPSPENKQLHFFQTYLKSIEQDPASYGFDTARGTLSFDDLKSLTIYQLGAMIVKTEDYYSLVGDGYRIRPREVGTKDAFRLISASGIRGFSRTHFLPGNHKHEIDQQIMKYTFSTALLAAETGYVVFPAVGMGVWRGDPEIYWKAFLDAVVSSADQLDHIFINPGHQKTPNGKYQGYGGEEFALLLSEYQQKHPGNRNLRKIINLFDRKTDLLLLASNLKRACPDKNVSLFNASDPDVTLGSHVGEYVNNTGHAPTTEENFAAAGTSGLGFEDMTNVLSDPKRVLQF